MSTEKFYFKMNCFWISFKPSIDSILVLDLMLEGIKVLPIWKQWKYLEYDKEESFQRLGILVLYT